MTRVSFRLLDGAKIVAAYNVKIVETDKEVAYGETENPKDCAVLTRTERRYNDSFAPSVIFGYEYADDKAPEIKKKDYGRNYSDILREEKEEEKKKPKVKVVEANTEVNGEEVNNMSKDKAATPATPATPKAEAPKKVSVASIIVANKEKSFEEIVKIVKAQRPDVSDSTIKVQYNKAKKG